MSIIHLLSLKLYKILMVAEEPKRGCKKHSSFGSEILLTTYHCGGDLLGLQTTQFFIAYSQRT